ncbi:LysM peptidoglycan-binding domain-containing protein [Nocardioides euryhalodurans]|uniref:LysM domain-containing protein n=1 Tax=Nocardioides euryhalodurans TaxID=2518370 RepID=A0A4P7GJ07_9ACTN|nr:LysM domain-containing protein [Nocardioides euryhalodurans]QBR91956.1 LysM domain-containing protein [Nocardioides euryhalodurans]
MAVHGGRTTATVSRCLAVWSAATVAAGSLLGWLVPGMLRHSPGHASFEAALVLGCQAAAAVCAAWLWTLVSLVALDASRGLPERRTAAPTLLRRVVLLACGLGVVGGMASPALAGQGSAGESPATRLAGLPLPDRPSAGLRLGHLAGEPPSTTPAAEAARTRTVVVSPGDTLWSIAAADLHQGATATAVDEHWRAVHAANRAVIGPDPHLITPGQWLRLPPPDPPSPA